MFFVQLWLHFTWICCAAFPVTVTNPCVFLTRCYTRSHILPETLVRLEVFLKDEKGDKKNRPRECTNPFHCSKLLFFILKFNPGASCLKTNPSALLWKQVSNSSHWKSNLYITAGKRCNYAFKNQGSCVLDCENKGWHWQYHSIILAGCWHTVRL